MVFAGKSGCGVGGILAVVEDTATSMVNKDGSTCKALFFTAKRSVETAWICRQVVISGDTVTRIEVTTLQYAFVGRHAIMEVLTDTEVIRCCGRHTRSVPMGLRVETASALEWGDVTRRATLDAW